MMQGVDTEKGHLNRYLDVDLINRVKHASIDEERRLPTFVAQALEEYWSNGRWGEEMETK